MTVNERIKILVDTFANGVPARFAKQIGVSATVIASYMPGGRESKPSYEVLLKILETFKQLRTDWVMSGEGTMIKEGSQEGSFINNKIEQGHGNQIGNIHSGGSSNQAQTLAGELERCKEKLAMVQMQLDDRREYIEELRARVEELKTVIAENKETIATLRESAK